MGDDVSLGDILNKVMATGNYDKLVDGQTPEERAELLRLAQLADAVSRSSNYLAIFLKALPDDVDRFKLLNIIDEFVGHDIGSETLRNLLGVAKSSGAYVLKPLNSHANLEKIPAIRVVRTHTGAGLREAKDCVEGTEGLAMGVEVIIKMGPELAELGYSIQPV